MLYLICLKSLCLLGDLSSKTVQEVKEKQREKPATIFRTSAYASWKTWLLQQADGSVQGSRYLHVFSMTQNHDECVYIL